MGNMLHYETSVLIIGSGFGGLSCALELWENGFKDIFLLAKSSPGDARSAEAAGGVNAAMAENDSAELHFADTFLAGDMLAEPEMVYEFTKKEPDEMAKLLGYGVNFHRDDDGKLTLRFSGGQTIPRTLFTGDEIGRGIIKPMGQKLMEYGIPVK